jgi:hypothetical protein
MRGLTVLLLASIAAFPKVAFAIDPRDALRAAVRAYEGGDLHKAVPLLRAATRATLAPRERARAWLFLGLTLASLGRPRDARTPFQEALRDDPELRVDPQRVHPAVVDELERVRKTTFGDLHVTSEKGARVIVAGIERGLAPLSLRLPVGRYMMRVVSEDGHRAYSSRPPGVLVAARSPTNLLANLEPLFGKLRLESTPAGAEITLDQRALGRTPIGPIAIAAGLHRVAARRSGFRAEWREILVAPETSLELRLHLRRAPAWYRTKRALGAIALGLSAAATAAGLWLGHSARAFEEELRFVERAGALSQSRYVELSNGATSRALAANATFGIAGAAAVTGIILLLWDRASPAKSARLRASPSGLAVKF